MTRDDSPPIDDLIRIALARFRIGDDLGAILLTLATEAYERGWQERARPSVPAGAWSDDEVTERLDLWERDTEPPGADYDAREMDRRARRKR